MAGAHDLTGRTGRRIATPLVAIGVGVLIAHAVLIEGVAQITASPSPIKKMAAPVFARLLVPVSPVPLAPALGQGPAQTATAPRDRLGVSAEMVSVTATTAATTAARAAASSASAPATRAAEATATPAVPATIEPPPSPLPSPAASATPATPAPDPWPADTRLSYRLEGRFRSGPLYGSARVQWQRQGPTYQTQVEIDLTPFGHRTLTSQGEVTPQGLVPRTYEERTNNRRRAIRLEDAQVTLTDGRTLPRPADVQDTASQFVELGHRFATGRQALTLGGVVPVLLARPGGVDLWTYDVVSQDLLTIPRLGEVMAWRLKPRPPAQRRDNLSAEIWFAPSLQYLPVRIRLTMGDEAEIDLQVETIEQR